MYFYIYPKVRATKMDLNVERWYSMKEICEYLGVSRDTVLAWIEKREMPATKIGRLWKFKISEIRRCGGEITGARWTKRD